MNKKDKIIKERAGHSWVAGLLFLFSFLLLFLYTIPAFQEERKIARILERQKAYRKKLEKLRKRYAVKAKALIEDPQEARDLYLKLKEQGLIK